MMTMLDARTTNHGTNVMLTAWARRSAIVLIALGCSPTDDSFGEPTGTGGTGGASGGAGGGAGSPVGTGGTGGSFGGTGGSGAGVAGSGSVSHSAGTGGSSSAVSDLPCDVQQIVTKSCATCHSDPPRYTAPMPLVTAADFRRDAMGKTVGERVIERINDDVDPMPQAPVARLTQAERDVLENWIDAGSPSGTCASGGAGGTGGAAGGTGGSGGSGPVDPDVTCYNLTARTDAGGAPYSVPLTPDLYQCFYYNAPWGDKKVHVVSAKPIIYNEANNKVLHHWILYNSTDPVTDGTNSSCSGAHPNAAFIHGWAPGGNELDLPADVGLRIEGPGFSLEAHYNNKEGGPVADASGVELCVTEKLRPKEAAIHWLGTQALNKIEATGTCLPVATGPVTILSSSPHMHLQGRHMKTVINRLNGQTEVLHDKPFSFSEQVSYLTPAVINPGDTLTTTCTYAQPTPFGMGTNEEMCYNFVMAYPAGQLAQLIQGLRKYDCTGL
jgi:hypothetical protein